ncbi:MAG: GlsB/YeaQ/YmgE family stress response membrane protein [Chloroflexota bacterium]
MTISITIPDLIVWIIVGLLAGTAASSVMRSGRRNALVNTLIGLVGALIGGFIFAAFNINIPALAAIQINAQQLLAAFIGAILLILLVRVLRRA